VKHSCIPKCSYIPFLFIFGRFRKDTYFLEIAAAIQDSQLSDMETSLTRTHVTANINQTVNEIEMECQGQKGGLYREHGLWPSHLT
jgi:hypothetical protein